MKPVIAFRALLMRAFLVVVAVGLTCTAGAQGTATGIIEGRVLDARRGEYLEKARIVVEGTNIEEFTDSIGAFRLMRVPVGPAKVKIFYTGFDTHTETVVVSAGQTSTLDVSMGGALRPSTATAATPGGEQAIMLDQFVVSSSKEMDGAAIAINEQRFAANLVNVVSADEFGTIADGSVGEFMKFLPGVVSDYTGGDARRFSINGVPAGNVPITVGGFDLASAAGAGTGRQVELDQVSINAISRIEVHQAPTPESPGSALAGMVNMVPRSAFERSRPVTNYSVHMMLKPWERDLKKTPGPHWADTYKIQPGFDFSHINPVSKNFGFTVTAGYSKQYTPQDNTYKAYRGVGLATNGTGWCDTTPDNPYLCDYQVRDSGKHTTRYSFSTTLDWRVARYDRLSFAYSYAFLLEEFGTRYYNFYVGAMNPGNWGPTFSHGTSGKSSMNLVVTARTRPGGTHMPTITWRHDGPLWKSELGVGYSRSRIAYLDTQDGYFNSSSMRRSGLTIWLDDIDQYKPNKITVMDSKGVGVDPYKIENYAIYTVSTNPRLTYDTKNTLFANVRRDFMVRNIPVSLKVGFDYRSSARDMTGSNPTMNWVGADGKQTTNPTSGDDSAVFAYDDRFSLRNPPWSFPKFQVQSNKKLWDAYVQNPSYVKWDQNTEYRSQVLYSKRVEETIPAGYFRTDASFFDRRLKIVTGIRVEQTNVDARGPLSDLTLNYKRDAAGNIMYDSSGKPLKIATDTYEVSKLTYLERGSHVEKEYLRLFPSLNASYNVRENLIARFSAYKSVGRPDNNQYAGGATLPDPELSSSDSNIITVYNPLIKVWDANTMKFRLEYYFERVGQISIGVFRRDFNNFFADAIGYPSDEFLLANGIDPDIYGDYRIKTQYNLVDRVRMEGLDIDYKQALTFLPDWARGFQVFGNASWQVAKGAARDEFSGFIPRSFNWGISFSRPKYNARINWNYRGYNRGDHLTEARGVLADTYYYYGARLYIDISAEYFFSKRFGIFANIRNLNETTQDVYLYNSQTPDWARFRQCENYHALWTFGIKGSF